MRLRHECGKSHNNAESLRKCAARIIREADEKRERERGMSKSVTVTLTGEEAELAIDALTEAGHNCDRAVGRESKSGAAFRAVARKIREARA